MFNRFRSSALLLSGLLLAAGSAANAQFLTNGSFELAAGSPPGPPLTGGQIFLPQGSPSITGWTIGATGAPAGLATQDIGWSNIPYITGPASDGVRSLDMSGSEAFGDKNDRWATVSQTTLATVAMQTATNLQAGTLYTFSFDLQGFGGASNIAGAKLTIAGATAGNGIFSFTQAGDGTWGTKSANFTAPAIGSMVTFTIAGDTTTNSGVLDLRHIGVDNARITAVPLNAVPEMPGAAMLLPALLPVGLMLGRKRRKS